MYSILFFLSSLIQGTLGGILMRATGYFHSFVTFFILILMGCGPPVAAVAAAVV